jgi:hypothetical protein
MRTLISFLRVFFGTPRRAIATAVTMVLCAIVEYFFPGVLGEIAYRMVRVTVVPVGGAILRVLYETLGPFLQPILTLAVIIFGFRMIWRGFRGR